MIKSTDMHHFLVKPMLPLDRRIVFLRLFWKRAFEFIGIGFCGWNILPVTQPRVSQHWKELNALTADGENVCETTIPVK